MKRTWNPPTPLDMICPDCRVALPRGTEWHRCNPLHIRADADRKFRRGDSVGLSLRGRTRLRIHTAFRAVVCGFSRDKQCVYVRRDGQKTNRCYHGSFLELNIDSAPASDSPNE